VVHPVRVPSPLVKPPGTIPSPNAEKLPSVSLSEWTMDLTGPNMTKLSDNYRVVEVSPTGTAP